MKRRKCLISSVVLAGLAAVPFMLVGAPPNIRIETMKAIGHTHTVIPPTYTGGDTVAVKYHLRNDSADPAGAFHVGLRVGGTIIARNAYSELVNGADCGGEFSWTATCGAAVEVVADCDGEVAESNEGDNVMTDPELSCTMPNLLYFRDLECSGGTTPKAGLYYRFSATLHSDLVRTRNVRVTGGVVGGAVLYDHTFAELAGEALQRVEFDWEVPEGAHRMYMQFDPDNAIAESNESDNRQELAITGEVIAVADEYYDLQIKIDRARTFGVALGRVELTLGQPVTIYGEVRGATGSIRDFKVTGSVRTATALTKIYTQDFHDPGMLVVPFSFTWTPAELGDNTISVHAGLGPHAVAVGVVDRVPANNTAAVTVKVVKPSRLVIKR